jgi:triacylglycerol lipase
MSVDMERPDPPVLSPTQSEAVPTWRAAYSDRTSALMAHFCELARVPLAAASPAPPPGSPKIEREAGRKKLEELLSAGNFCLIEVFNKDEAQAFLAVRDGHFAVLAFRGSESPQDWRTNRNFKRVPLPGVPGVTVHGGFLEVFECCRKEIEAAVNAHVPSTLGLYITGHSLGGALAQIASAVLDRDNLAACYTFGSPRVGTANFDRQVKCPHYRVINNWDLIPGVPLPWFRGYRHTGDPRLLTPGTGGPLRRDRYASFLVDIAALVVVSLLSRRPLITGDHMIWNYRTQLLAIAAARTGPRLEPAL